MLIAALSLILSAGFTLSLVVATARLLGQTAAPAPAPVPPVRLCVDGRRAGSVLFALDAEGSLMREYPLPIGCDARELVAARESAAKIGAATLVLRSL